MSNIRKLEDYRFIDIFKFFCALLVIGIHTSPFFDFGVLDNTFGLLTRIAVPFFFVSSSFFLFKKQFSWKRIFIYTKRMLVLYVIYSAMYVVYDLLTEQFNLFNSLINFFVSGYQHLWFLQQSVIAVLVIALITQVLKKQWLLYVLSIVFYIIGVLIFTYRPLVNDIPIVVSYHGNIISQIIYERSWLFYGVPYMAIGFYFANNEFVKKKWSLIGMIASFLLLAIESFAGIFFFKTTSTVLWFSAFPLSFFIFSFVAQIRIKREWNTVALRKIATLIYCIHLLVVYLLIYAGVQNHMLLFLSTVIISLIYGVVIIKLSALKKFKFFSILY